MSTVSSARAAIVLSALLLVLSSPSVAQVRILDEPVFRSYGMADGLSHGAILALIQSRAGFLWMGTQDGLNRFDGVSFRAYKHDPNDPMSLSDDFIEALAEGPDGRIWVGTNRGGLNRFDPTNGGVERFELGPWAANAEAVQAEGRQNQAIYGIAVLADGDLLLASDMGLVSFNATSATYTLLFEMEREPGSVRWQICGLTDGRALAALPARVVASSQNETPSAWSIAVVEGQGLAPIITFRETIRGLRCPRGDGEGYAVTTDGRVHSFDLIGDRRQILSLLSPAGQPLIVDDLLAGPDDKLWLATLEGLYVAERTGGPARRVGTDASRGLTDTRVISLLTDRTGILWVGTWNGLAAVHPLAFTMRRVPSARGDSPGLFGSGVIAIQSAGEGDLWIGASLGGVQLLTEEPQTNSFLVTRPSALAELAAGRIMDLASELDGTLWIAALADGLFRLDASTNRLSRVPIRSRDGDVVRPDVYSVFVDGHGEVWAGTRNRGLVKLNAEGTEFRPFSGPEGAWDFGAQWVWPITEDPQGNLWVGAYSGGLHRIDPDRRGRQLYSTASLGPGLDRILTLYVDSRELVWVGTEGLGMSRLDPRTGAFRLYTTRDGLPHDNVEAITEDATGDLWISTNDGVARFDVEREQFRTYRETVGLTGNRFFANSVYRDPDGKIYFGGERGLTILDPSSMAPGQEQPAAALTAFQLNGREAPLGSALAPGGLDLEPDENFFAFEFAGLDFRDPTEQRYRYRLVGLDDDWIGSGTRRVANYTSVPPGTYTFLVAVGNGDGVWNDEAISIPVRVQAPYYQTFWFRASMLVMLVGLISAVYAYRLSELRRRQEFRLAIAGKMHDDIGANLSTIALKAGMLEGSAAGDAHLRGQLVAVGRLARESALRVRETVWVVNTQYDTLAGLITKMRDTADTMLAGHVALRFSVPDALPDRRIGMELRQAVYLTFKEALQNVVKHAEATAVEVDVAYEHPNLTLRVRDDGKGCDWSHPSAGNGLGLMRARMTKHGGEVLVSGGPGIGTTVFVSIRIR